MADTEIFLKLNTELTDEAERFAAGSGLTLRQFLEQLIESHIASRRIRAIPAEIVADPNDYWRPPRRRVARDDMSGPLNTHKLHFPRR